MIREDEALSQNEPAGIDEQHQILLVFGQAIERINYLQVWMLNAAQVD